MTLISYPCFCITITMHPIWKISFPQKWLENQTISNANAIQSEKLSANFQNEGRQRCPAYYLLMLSMVVIQLRPCTDSGRHPFLKSSKTQNESEMLQTSCTKMDKIPKQLVLQHFFKLYTCPVSHYLKFVKRNTMIW